MDTTAKHTEAAAVDKFWEAWNLATLNTYFRFKDSLTLKRLLCCIIRGSSPIGGWLKRAHFVTITIFVTFSAHGYLISRNKTKNSTFKGWDILVFFGNKNNGRKSMNCTGGDCNALLGAHVRTNCSYAHVHSASTGSCTSTLGAHQLGHGPKMLAYL